MVENYKGAVPKLKVIYGIVNISHLKEQSPFEDTF